MIRKQLKKWWPAIMLTAISLQPAAAQNVEKLSLGNPFSLFLPTIRPDLDIRIKTADSISTVRLSAMKHSLPKASPQKFS